VPYAGENTPRVDLAIEFATGSDEISALGQTVLSRLAKVLQETDLIGARFAVAGHTDRTGSDALNLELSCARAIAARRFLISQGVGHERLAAYGFGSSKPLDANAYESQSNRRVEFRRAE
jgi:OOP family OmpA-OmpF porin